MLDFDEDSIKNYNKDIKTGYFLEFTVQYVKKIHKINNNLKFLVGRMKFEKCQMLVFNILHIETSNKASKQE